MTGVLLLYSDRDPVGEGWIFSTRYPRPWMVRFSQVTSACNNQQ
jgi:hypothetical protein